MHIHIPVPWTKHETASELKRVVAKAMLPVSCCASTTPGVGVVAPKQMQDAANLKLCCPISDSLIIHQQRKRDAGFFPEKVSVSEIAQTYSRKLSSRASEIALMIAQLRDVLPAENSPIMAKKNKNSGALLPQGAELYFASTRIR